MQAACAVPAAAICWPCAPTRPRISDAILRWTSRSAPPAASRGSPAGCRGNKSRCLTHDLWEELGNQIHLFLSSVSLADVCERRVLGSSRLMPIRATRACRSRQGRNRRSPQRRPRTRRSTPMSAARLHGLQRHARRSAPRRRRRSPRRWPSAAIPPRCIASAAPRAAPDRGCARACGRGSSAPAPRRSSSPAAAPRPTHLALARHADRAHPGLRHRA